MQVQSVTSQFHEFVESHFWRVFDIWPNCVQCARTHRWLLNNHYVLCNIVGKSVISWSSKWSRLPLVQAQSSFIPEFWQNRRTKNMDETPDKTTEVGLISVIFFKIFVSKCTEIILYWNWQLYKWVLNFSYEVKSLSVGFFECGDESSELHN